MAARSKRQRRFAVRFDLGIGGLLGLVVVSLCVFLWLFLLGVWAGQTVLSPSSSASSSWVPRFASHVLPPAGQQDVDEQDEPEAAPVEAEVAVATPAAVEEETKPSAASCFSLQVGAFREESNAAEVVAEWKAKGYEAFTLAPREGSNLVRVFVGRFDDLAAANKLVAELEAKEKLRAYITLVPAAGK
ncbi:MAG: SPOR domain-containing protein [Desulfobulbaceae bacterium]|nr:SPOR domain-containing protein [Desulfobulbaceae bacterium]